MSTFLRLLSESDKAEALMVACSHLRQGENDFCCFEVASESFDPVPGKPFAYWVGDKVLSAFRELKGGAYSPFYADLCLVVNWADRGAAICNFVDSRSGRLLSRPQNTDFFLRPGLTWTLRSQLGFGMRAMPAGYVFGHKGPASFSDHDNPEELLALLALANSRPFRLLVSLQMAVGSYEVGVIQRTPVPSLGAAHRKQLPNLARRAWSLKRTDDSVTETSHAFVLPAALCAPTGYDQSALKIEIDEIHSAIDTIAFDLYGFAEADREAVNGPAMKEAEAEEDDEKVETDAPSTDGLLSWAVGVAFGRFDLRIATGERPFPPEPEPFDPLPTKSPGMLPEGAQLFNAHEAVLVDEQGHPYDLVHLVEDVLGRVNAPVPDDVRRWLRKNFFASHLKLFSKSRRKAPIYRPLTTASGSYTLWLYYPGLSSQMLYTAINDFIEPKLKQIGSDVTALRNKGAARSRDDEKQFEALQYFELELIELRYSLLKLAPTYKPNQNDGVQVSAAPLWPFIPPQALAKGTQGHLGQVGKGKLRLGAPCHELLAGARA